MSLQKPAAGSLTLAMASEVSSLALIAYILEIYRAAGPSAGVDGHEIASLNGDGKQVKEDIEELLGNREGLRSRIVATDDKEFELPRALAVDGAGSAALFKLEERIVRELKSAMMCLNGGVE